MPDLRQRQVIKEFNDGGQIAIEPSRHGINLRFDCNCLDALPICQAQCCCIPGVGVEADEREPVERAATKAGVSYPSVVAEAVGEQWPFEMRHKSNGECVCLDSSTRKCRIYKDRPATCREFHCSKGTGGELGWCLTIDRMDEGE